MGFKIADAFVVVDPKDDGFEVGLKRIVEEAAAGTKAEVGVGLTKDAPEELRGDIDAALLLVTDRLDANVGLGLRNDAVEELDADVKAGVELVQDNNKIKVKVDPQSAKGAGQGASALIMAGLGVAATAGPGLILAATAGAVVAAAALVTHGNAELASSYQKLGQDASDAIHRATQPLIPDLKSALNILDQGVLKLEPDLKSVFAAAGPEATAFTSGMVSLASNALPGIATGLRAIAPEAQLVNSIFGQLGTGIGGLFEGLSTGADGGMVGLSALIDVASHLLTDVGQITGSLSNGLGPALHDVSDVAIPVAGALTDVVKAFPPGDIRIAADATAALFAAFKLASLAGVVAEGTTFIGFLQAATSGEIALTGETGVLTTATAGLEAALAAATGPVGLLVVGLGGLAVAGKDVSLVNADAKNKTSDLANVIGQTGAQMQAAGDGSKQMQQGLDGVVATMRDLKNAGGDTTAAMTALDQQLARISLTDPNAGAADYQRVLTDLGLTAKQGAAVFPQYTATITDAGDAAAIAGRATGQFADQTAYALPPAERLISALTDSQQKLAQQAVASGLASVAALSYAGNQDALNTRVSAAVSDYTLASGAASAFKSAEDALYGMYATYSQAQATLTTDLANAAGQFSRGKDAVDLNTKAGAANFTIANQLAQANAQVAESLIKEGGSQDQATVSLQKGAQAIDDLARKSGLTDKQIQQLNMELYGVPTVKEITFRANTAPVLGALDNTIARINDSYGTIQVYANVHNPAGGKALGFNASGGDVQAGDVSVVGEKGPEIVVFGRAGTVVPNDQIRTVGGTSSNSRAAGLGMTIHTLNISIPMQGIVDFTNPISMDANARRMAISISNALVQVRNARTGAAY